MLRILACGYAELSSLHLAPRVEKGNFPSCLFKLQMQFFVTLMSLLLESPPWVAFFIPCLLVWYWLPTSYSMFERY